MHHAICLSIYLCTYRGYDASHEVRIFVSFLLLLLFLITVSSEEEDNDDDDKETVAEVCSSIAEILPQISYNTIEPCKRFPLNSIVYVPYID